jgi:mannose-6-phosphate isomerase-like protein (cupin superfamily)
MNPSYIKNLSQAAAENQNFRQVLFTGPKSQLVVMNIPAGQDIGEETHAHVEQILYIQAGTGQTILDGVVSDIGPGSVVVVTPGTKHNLINTGSEPLIIATVYVPANHPDGTVHATKADALADEADEAFAALL